MLTNSYAEKKLLQTNIESLCAGPDIISEVRYKLEPYLFPQELALISIYKKLKQPEELLNFQPKEIKHKSFSKKSPLKKSKTSKKNIHQTQPTVDKEKFATLLLNEDSPHFSEINNLIQEINSFISNSSNKGEAKEKIFSWLESVKQYYISFRTEVCKSQGRKRSDICSGKIRVRGSLGFYYLNAGASLRFNAFFNLNNENEKSSLVSRRDNEYGFHPVFKLPGVAATDTYLKKNPTDPAIEHAFKSLTNIISGQETTPTDLLIFEKGQSAFPVLASKAIEGENFFTLLQEHPDWIDKIDPYNYSAHFILTLLMCSADGKPDNFIAILTYKENTVVRIRIVGIDNDVALGPPYIANRSTDKLQHYLDLKSIFFCMPQMDRPLDPLFQRNFLKQPPALIMLQWFKDLLLQEEVYKRLYQDFEKTLMALISEADPKNDRDIIDSCTEQLKAIRIPLKLLPDTLQKVYQRLCRIQLLIKYNVQTSHANLLKEIFPAVADCYGAIKDEPTILEQYEKTVFGISKIEKLPNLSDAAKEELKEHIRDNAQINNDRTETVLEAAVKFINTFDYLNLNDDDLQKIIIDKIIGDFSFLQIFVFDNAKILTDDHLTALAEARNKIKSVKLINCNQINGSGLIAIVYHNSDVQICLEHFKSLSVSNLLYLVQHCKNLQLILDGKIYPIKENKISSELFTYALQHEYMPIVNVALLSGVHLNSEYGYQPPLHIAIQEMKLTVVKGMIDSGASLDVLNNENKSPLDIALAAYRSPTIRTTHQQKYKELILLLIKQGALVVENPKAILELFKDMPSSPEFFMFARYNNLLTPETAWLIPTHLTELALGSERNKYDAVTLSSELIDALQQRLFNLKKLNIEGCLGLTMPIYFKILGWLNLETISMDFNQVLQCNLANIQKLDAAAELYSNKVAIHITSLVLSKKLMDELRGLDKSETKRFASLKDFICKNKHLKRLEILNCQLTDGEVKYLAKAFAENLNLESFFLKGNLLSDQGIKILLEALSTQKNLCELSITETQAGFESAKALGEIIIHNPNLEVLSLISCPSFGDNGIEELANAMQLPRKNAAVLKKLILNQLNMSEASAYVLSKALMLFKTLVFLDIAYNPLDDIGGEYFLELLQLNTGLTVIKCDQIGSTVFEKNLQEQAAKNLDNRQKSTLNVAAQNYQSQDQQYAQELLSSQYWELQHLRRQVNEHLSPSPLKLPSLPIPDNTKSPASIRNFDNGQSPTIFKPKRSTTKIISSTQPNVDTQHKSPCYETSGDPTI